MDYEIKLSTLLLIPNQSSTIIWENDDLLEANCKVNKIIDLNCRQNGSSYEGRLCGTKFIIGVSVKAPILIEDSSELILFPTKSPRCDDCIWISFNNIKRYIKKDVKTTIIEFKNDRVLDIPISYKSFDNQIMRCMKLKVLINERKKRILS